MSDTTEMEILRTSATMDIAPGKPAMSIQEAKEFFAAVQQAKKELLDKSDFIEFKSKDGKIRYAIVKAALEKLAVYMGVGTFCKPAIYIEHPETSSFSYQVIAIAYRGGRAVTDMASCSSLEKDFMDKGNAAGRKEHDVLTMASTRAQGRALRKFLAIEEPTAEEIAGMESDNKSGPQTVAAADYCNVNDGTHFHDMTKNICKTTNKKLK